MVFRFLRYNTTVHQKTWYGTRPEQKFGPTNSRTTHHGLHNQVEPPIGSVPYLSGIHWPHPGVSVRLISRKWPSSVKYVFLIHTHHGKSDRHTCPDVRGLVESSDWSIHLWTGQEVPPTYEHFNRRYWHGNCTRFKRWHTLHPGWNDPDPGQSCLVRLNGSGEIHDLLWGSHRFSFPLCVWVQKKQFFVGTHKIFFVPTHKEGRRTCDFCGYPQKKFCTHKKLSHEQGIPNRNDVCCVASEEVWSQVYRRFVETIIFAWLECLSPIRMGTAQGICTWVSAFVMKKSWWGGVFR